MFEAHAKRMAAERVMQLKNSMISGVWANSNYDDDKDTRNRLLAQIDEYAENALDVIYNIERVKAIDENEFLSYDEVKDSPFWRAMKVPKIDHSIDHERSDELDG